MCGVKWERARVCTHEARLQAPSRFYIVYFHSYGFLLSRTDVGGNPQNQSWSRTIITAILIKVSHCDPLIFSQCWLHSSAVATSITKLQPVINLHIIYMSPNQDTANPNPKITSTWTEKSLPLSNLNIFILHSPIFMWKTDDTCVLHMRKLRYGWVCNT